MVTSTSRIRVPAEVKFREIDGETVLLDLDSGLYFGLDEVGTRMWLALVEHELPAAAVDALLGEFDVDRERLEKDLMELVDQLAAKRLIEVAE